ncbi:MAG: hypothetical protein JNK82_29390 [Myxococcaceae bacterium]|nr:hypothetical protein [Myxococcaceae bacterium]
MVTRRLATAALLLAACGYRFTAPGGPLPAGIRYVHAPVFVNVTPEPGAEAFFTEALREQLIRAGTLGGELSEAKIEGTVLAVSAFPMLTPISDGGIPRPTYRLTATVGLRLLKNGAVVGATQVSGEEDVLSGVGASSDVIVTGTEANRQAGLRRLADSLMREGYERLCTGW